MNHRLVTLALTLLPLTAGAHDGDTIDILRLHAASQTRAIQVNEVLERLERRIVWLEHVQKQLILRATEHQGPVTPPSSPAGLELKEGKP